MSAQEFSAVKVNIRDPQLDQAFRKYEVYQLNPDPLVDYVRANPNGSVLTMQFGDEHFEWHVYERQLLTPDCRVRTYIDGRYQDLVVDRTCRTFIGYRPDVADEARFTISKTCFAAMIPDGKSRIMIQPIAHLTGLPSGNLVVLYRNSDVMNKRRGICDASKPLQQDRPDPEHEQELVTGIATQSRTFDCIALRLAFATDHRMYGTYDSEEAILDFNLSVLNFVEPFYDDLDIDFFVKDFFIVSTINPSGTPWSHSLDMDELKDSFEDWADDHFGDTDIGHLWTSGDIYKDDFDYSILGRADIGGACGDIGITPWAILENHALTELYDLALLQAHEYGHLLDAEHAPGTGSIMEPNFGDVEGPTWAPISLVEMIDFIEDEDCIATCRFCPFVFNVIDYIGWGDWRYSALDNIRSTAVIDSLADVRFLSEQYIRLLPGFQASSLQPSSGGATFRAYIGDCPY